MVGNENTAKARSTSNGTAKRKRGAGRGGNFFVLDRGHWERLWTLPSNNRLNLATAFLVLLAGTGADHRLTKWSAKACEERVGMGKPRAKLAIDELIRGGLAGRTEASTPMFPQYRLAEPKDNREPIFLPVQLVTGFDSETPVLRRVRETGDPLVLRMLIDLYGLVQTDAAHGVPLENLRLHNDSAESSRKITEMGANAVWGLFLGNAISARGEWCNPHMVKQAGKNDWSTFWERVHILQRIGALWFEPWVFNGEGLDSEPLFPIEVVFGSAVSDEVRTLTQLCTEAAEALIGERTYLLEQNADRVFVVLPTHHQAPGIQGVARMRVEPDTPGRRLSFAKRMEAIERHTAAYARLIKEARSGLYNRPISLG